MAESNERNVLRYDAAIATLIGLLALLVSAYTAYEQHLQVRAQVWPILQVTGGNVPIRITVANKGVGPALVRDVVMRVDGKPVKTWSDAVQALIGPGNHNSYTTSIHNAVLAAGDTLEVYKPRDAAGHDISNNGQDDWAMHLYREMRRASIDICYCSTLDECWQLHSWWGGDTTVPVRRCTRSADAFED